MVILSLRTPLAMDRSAGLIRDFLPLSSCNTWFNWSRNLPLHNPKLLARPWLGNEVVRLLLLGQSRWSSAPVTSQDSDSPAAGGFYSAFHLVVNTLRLNSETFSLSVYDIKWNSANWWHVRYKPWQMTYPLIKWGIISIVAITICNERWNANTFILNSSIFQHR